METTLLSRLGQRSRERRRQGGGIRVLVSSLLALGVLALSPAHASAMGNPFTKNRAQVLGGFRFGSDYLNAGLGLKGGYTLPMDLYVGGSFDYFFGEHDESTVAGIRYESDRSAWVLTPEVGYDFGIIPALMVRPFGGIGLAAGSAETCSQGPGIDSCIDDSESDVVLTLGGLISYSIGPVFFGGELRFLIFNEEAVVLGLHAGGAF